MSIKPVKRRDCVSNHWRGPLWGESDADNLAGVTGVSSKYNGVLGVTKANGHAGVAGVSDDEINPGNGVYGRSKRANGVFGISSATTSAGVTGSNDGRGIAIQAIVHQSGGKLFSGKNQSGEVFSIMDNGNFVTKAHGTIHGALICGGKIATPDIVQGREFIPTSDKNTKENFWSVNTLEILDNLVNMPIQSWNYKEDTSSKRHIGPTAQDFHAAFGLNGDDNRLISSIDLQGVALAAIQGLNEKPKAENAELYAKLANLEERLSALEFKS